MGTCKFKTSEVRPVIEKALETNCKVLFVHDHGIYVMSGDLESRQIAFAKGCDPTADKDFYEEARNLVGGDDFAEEILVNPDWIRSCDRFDQMSVRVNSKSMSVSFVRQKTNSQKV